MLRNRFGRFLKRGHKRKHRARRRASNPHKKRRGRGRVHAHRRRRRSNPHMLLANPQQGELFPRVTVDQLVAKTVSAFKKSSKGGRKRKGAKRAGTSLSSKRRGRKYYRIYRGRGRSPKFRIFRRSNPFGAWMALVRLGVAGGLGIVAARVGGRLYTDHVSKMVLGATGAADPKSFRAILNEGLRIFAMGALPVLAERHVLRRLPMVTGADCMAFQLGGLAEAGRQGIGVIMKRVKPTLDAGRWGLDGELPYLQYHRDQAGMIYGLHPSGQWYAIGRGDGMSGLIAADRFGMDGLVDEDEFGMSGDDDDGEYADAE